jgi:hypothetical protein
MYTASSAQRVGQWAPEVSYMPLPYTGEVTLPYTVYKLVWEERPMVEPLSPAPSTEELVLAELYAEFAEEDRELAEMGLADYARLLREEEAIA